MAKTGFLLVDLGHWSSKICRLYIDTSINNSNLIIAVNSATAT